MEGVDYWITLEIFANLHYHDFLHLMWHMGQSLYVTSYAGHEALSGARLLVGTNQVSPRRLSL
jgi:hypothetical protein